MKVISLLAQKGGVGKTTLAIHFAVKAHQDGHSVALVDIDPQASLTRWMERRSQHLGTEEPIVLKAGYDQLAEVVGLCRDNRYDYVLIDTLPSVEEPAAAALKVSDLAVIPTGPASRDIDAIGSSIALAEREQVPMGILINMGRPGSPINAQAREVLAAYDQPIARLPIMRRAVIADSDINGATALEIEPKGKAALEIGRAWEWILRLANQQKGKS